MVTNTDAYQNLQPIHHDPTSFVKKYLFTTDHKVIAKQFLWTAIFFLFMGGALAVPHGYKEAVLTIIGVALVSLGHVLNLRHVHSPACKERCGD